MRRSDDFSESVVRTLFERAGTRCSLCDRQTNGPHSKRSKALRSGVAAHISAAQKGGPRFNPRQTPRARRSAANGIWVCHSCSDLIDKDPDDYSAKLLRDAKAKHERKIRSEHRGAARQRPQEEVLAFVRDSRREANERERLRAAAQREREEHQTWTDAAIASLRSGPGNAIRVATADETHARWAMAQGLLSGVDFKSGLNVTLRHGVIGPGSSRDDEDDPVSWLGG